MSVFALHLPEQRKPARWLVAAAVVVGVYITLAVIAIWHPRQPQPHVLVPAIAVTLAPAPAPGAAPPTDNPDAAIGAPTEQVDAAPPEPPKVEEQTTDEPVPPPPPADKAEAELPKPEPKQIEKPKEALPPAVAQEARAPPKNITIGQFTPAASNAYDALIVGHIERFKRYPAAARNAVGKATLQFTLDREGKVLDVKIVNSSGNSVLDDDAVATVRRAAPFPKFPTAKPGSEGIWQWTAIFDRK